MNTIHRRRLLEMAVGSAALLVPRHVNAERTSEREPAKESSVHPERGLQLAPGQWRPYFPWEHIAWVKTPWSDPLFPDLLFLDFPEAIFLHSELLFLSHTNPPFAPRFTGLAKVPWQTSPSGLHYERILPDGVRFGGSLSSNGPDAVRLALSIDNAGTTPLTKITLQTCVLLKHTSDFARQTLANKFVHTRGAGWQSVPAARHGKPDGRFRLGWRGGPPVADLPVMVTKSNQSTKLIGMSWYDDTYSLTGNPKHPCMHADPMFADIAPGQRRTIHGELLFFEGSLERFAEWFHDRWQSRRQAAGGRS